MTIEDIASLRDEWKELYSKKLPALAKAKDSAQPKWPVSLDHCFARIILDNTIGEGAQQWDKVIKKPAVQHMTPTQFRSAIDLGRDIEGGRIDICELDQISLSCRGKNPGKYGDNGKNDSSKRKRGIGEDEAGGGEKRAKTQKRQSTLKFSDDKSSSTIPKTIRASNGQSEDPATDVFFATTLQRIRAHPKLTPYRRRLYTILLSVPRGRYTTYAAMSDYLNSSARAVGSGMRNNPFAPDVPCHRCLAADGSIGGFNGDWGAEGKYASKKLQLLREEGVRFDGKGKVVGEPFRKFHEFEGLGDDKTS
jgi:O-6-methylguanine DNA methyltransferase